MTELIGICSAKGGVGKTTVSINLTLTLSKFFKKKILLVDFNLTAPHISLYLGMAPRKTLNEVLRGEISPKEAFESYFYDTKLLLASQKIEDLIGVNLSSLRGELEKVKDEFDYIIIDLAPGIGREAVNGILACDSLVIVAIPDIGSFSDLSRIKAVAQRLNKKIIGVVLNQVLNRKFEIEERDLQSLGLKLLAKIPFHEKFRESVNKKIPAVLDKSLPNEIVRSFLKISSCITGESIVIKESFWEKVKKFLGL